MSLMAWYRCPNFCSFSISEVELRSIRLRLDEAICPRCQHARLSDFVKTVNRTEAEHHVKHTYLKRMKVGEESLIITELVRLLCNALSADTLEAWCEQLAIDPTAKPKIETPQ